MELRALSAGEASDGLPSRWRRRRKVAAMSLGRQLSEAHRLGDVPDALLERYAIARNNFAELSGMVPEGSTAPEDVHRLRMLDAVILELSAVERELYLAYSDAGPDVIASAHSELLQRVKHPGAEPEASSAPRTLIDRLRAGEGMKLHLDISRLSPAGLVAIGQLLHFEPEVVVSSEVEPSAGSPLPEGSRRHRLRARRVPLRRRRSS